MEWTGRNHMLFNVDKTREIVIDFRRKGSASQPLCSLGRDVEMVEEYKYQGVTIDDGLSWKSVSTESTSST